MGSAVRDQWGSVIQQAFQCKQQSSLGCCCCPENPPAQRASYCVLRMENVVLKHMSFPFLPAIQERMLSCALRCLGLLVRILTGELREAHPSARLRGSSLWLLSSKAPRSAWFQWEFRGFDSLGVSLCFCSFCWEIGTFCPLPLHFGVEV